MNSAAEDIARFLESSSVGEFGGTNDWAIYAGSEPQTPTNCITIYEYAGEEPDTDELDVFRPGIQVRVRGLDYATAYAKHEVIRDLMILPRTGFDAVSSHFLVMLTMNPALLERDNNDRYVLVASYRTRRTNLE